MDEFYTPIRINDANHMIFSHLNYLQEVSGQSERRHNAGN